MLAPRAAVCSLPAKICPPKDGGPSRTRRFALSLPPPFVLKTDAILTRPRRGLKFARRAGKLFRAETLFRSRRRHRMSSDYPTSTQGEGRCPRCGEGTLKAWYEL